MSGKEAHYSTHIWHWCGVLLTETDTHSSNTTYAVCVWFCLRVSFFSVFDRCCVAGVAAAADAAAAAAATAGVIASFAPKLKFNYIILLHAHTPTEQ